MTYRLLALFGTILGGLPVRGVAALGRAFGLWVGFVLRIRLGEVRRALEETRVGASARVVYGRLGARLFLLLRAWSKPSAPYVRISHEAESRFPEGPFVLAGTHTGAWELAAFALRRTNRQVACIVHPPSVRPVRDFLTALRLRGGIVEIEPEGALSRATDELTSGKVVVCVADQVPRSKKHGIHSSFLGKPAWVDKAAAVLATRARVPLVVCGAHGEPGSEAAVVLDVLHPDGSGGVERLALRAHEVVEAFVRAHPEDWLWLHRRWREPKELRASAVALPLELSAGEG
ncbi:MAG: lysophospholipid acyltransferase family protein [Polyangiaceae bacterium]